MLGLVRAGLIDWGDNIHGLAAVDFHLRHVLEPSLNNVARAEQGWEAGETLTRCGLKEIIN